MTPNSPISPASSPAWRGIAIVFAAAFCACWSLGFNGLGWGRLHTDGLLFELIDRKDRAAHVTPSPKVIFLAGSSLLFGLDAPTLSARVGVPIVNDALVAPVGIDLIAERAAAHVGPGDVVIIAPEWALFVGRRNAIKDDAGRLEFLRRFGTRLPLAIEPFPRGPYRLARTRAASWIEDISDRWREILARNSTQRLAHPADVARIHTPADFDAAGNLLPGLHPSTIHRAQISIRTPERFAEAFDPGNGFVGDALDVLAAACRARGATLYAMPPVHVLPEGGAPDLYASLGARWQAFAAARAGAKPFLKPGETDFPLADAYDTEYHLNDHGRAALTERIAAALPTILDPTRRAPSSSVP